MTAHMRSKPPAAVPWSSLSCTSLLSRHAAIPSFGSPRRRTKSSLALAMRAPAIGPRYRDVALVSRAPHLCHLRLALPPLLRHMRPDGGQCAAQAHTMVAENTELQPLETNPVWLPPTRPALPAIPHHPSLPPPPRVLLLPPIFPQYSCITDSYFALIVSRFSLSC